MADGLFSFKRVYPQCDVHRLQFSLPLHFPETLIRLSHKFSFFLSSRLYFGIYTQMAGIMIPSANTLVTIILSLTLFIYITFSSNFSVKKMPPPLKALSFLSGIAYSQQIFPLIALTNFPLNLVFYTQQMRTDLRYNISTVPPDLPLRVPIFTLQTFKFTSRLSRSCSHQMAV